MSNGTHETPAQKPGSNALGDINKQLSLYNALALFVTLSNIVGPVIFIGLLILGYDTLIILTTVPLILCIFIVVLLVMRERALRRWHVTVCVADAKKNDDESIRIECERMQFAINESLFFVPSVAFGPVAYIVINLATTAITYAWLVKTAEARDRNYLWEEIVQPCIKDPHDKRCGNVQEISPGASFTNDGYLVLLDSSQYLMIPSRKVTGIEENKTQRALYNYWAKAWVYLEQTYPSAVESGKVGLAMNSKSTRDQDQLHIHMSCMNDTVYQQLTKASSQISSTWNKLTLGPKGQERTWYAIRVENITDGNNPFSVLNATDSNMEEQNLVVTKSQNPKDGFVILNSPDSSGDAMIYPRLTSFCQ